MTERNLYIIAGCNGAGKTTASFTILPDMIHCKEFVNADEIARGLSPFQPEKAAFEAGRIMLKRISQLLLQRETFAFETTLATRVYKHTLIQAKELDYTIHLVFFWLQSVELARERVATRVLEGGHYIDPDIIERRFYRGIKNLFDIYLPIVDGALIFDNSEGKPQLIAEKTSEAALSVLNITKYKQILSLYDHH
ncbi:MAG TPA: zeta toxin family protein [Phnomibacter sp.]|nr:zeta toxin family protein [Phnomibacter sp.]